MFGWPWIILLQYSLLAVVNLIEFSIYEARSDQADGRPVLSASWPAHRPAIVFWLLMVQGPLCVLALLQSRRQIVAESILLLMNVGLWIVIARPRAMARAERYRTLGDGVFLFPLIILAMRA